MPTKDIETYEEFVNLKNANHWLLLDFWASWCGPCKTMTPIFSRVAARRDHLLAAAKINVDKVQALAEEYNIRGVPTFILLRDGEVYDQRIGALSERDFIDWIDTTISTQQQNTGAQA